MKIALSREALGTRMSLSGQFDIEYPARGQSVPNFIGLKHGGNNKLS
jgi:hypothetical protein